VLLLPHKESASVYFRRALHLVEGNMVSFRKTVVPVLLLVLTLSLVATADAPKLEPAGYLFIANQYEHTALLVDLATKSLIARIEVGVNGHEVVVAPDGHFGYVPIYGNSGVGKPGTDGDRIDIIDLKERKLSGSIPLGKPVRPHCAKFGPDGLLYVSAELAQAIYVIDVNAKKIVGEIPTGAIESHMFVLSPDGKRAYTSNVHAGSVSVLDIEKRSLITVIPVAKIVQRISISPDGKHVFTHDQDQPRIAVIDTSTNAISGWIAVGSTVYSSTPLTDDPYGLRKHTMLAYSPAGKLFLIDLDSLKQIGESDACKSVGELTPTSWSSAYLTCPATGQLLLYNGISPNKYSEIKLTPGIDGIQWFPAVK
jgi:YVTN family beta-propeller protein